MVRARGLDRTIGVGVLLFLAGGVAQFLVLALSIGSVLPVFATEMLFFAGVGFVMPHSVAGMLSPFPERAGAATSLAGFFQFTFSAVVGLIVVASIAGSAMPLAVMNLLLGISACVAFFATVALRARHARLRSGAIR
ncbi:MAG: multidrug effflux MFS transporter [Alphaproteobacteria bacterium]|nr:multidrug effflux MFS transporter [Alphaproteobacteria bacterium]